MVVTTHVHRYKPLSYQRQRSRPRTCESMIDTLQVDRLARITGLSGSHSRLILSHRTASSRALYDILVLDGGRDKTMSDLVDGNRELPANTVKLYKADLNKTRKARQSRGRERKSESERRGGTGGKRERSGSREARRERSVDRETGKDKEREREGRERNTERERERERERSDSVLYKDVLLSYARKGNAQGLH